MAIVRNLLLSALLTATVSTTPYAAPPRPELLLDPIFRDRAVTVLGQLPTTRMLGRQRAADAAPGFLPSGKNVPTLTNHFTPVALLVDFPNRAHDATGHEPPDYAAVLFGTTGKTVYTYFDEVSYGKFLPRGNAASIAAWHTLGAPASSYLGTDQGIAESPRLVADAVAAHDDAVDFASFDNDGPDGIPDSGDDDGFVDALLVVHAGWGWEDSGLADDFASHYRALPTPIDTADIGFDGHSIRIADYIVVPEESFKLDVVVNDEAPPIQNGNEPIVEIGVLCHELGHVLGLPDLYDTTFQSWGIGTYGLMAYGLWGPNYDGGVSPEASRHANQPGHLSPWSKTRLGWLTPTPVWTEDVWTQLRPVEAFEQATVLYANSRGSEYFLVEHRKSRGFDDGFADTNEGALLVWHIDEDVLASGGNLPNNNRFWKGVDVECADGLDADGLDDLDLRQNFFEFADFYADPATAAGSSVSFGPNSNPASTTNLGLPTAVRVDGLQTFTTGPLTPMGFFASAGAVVLDPASFTATATAPDRIGLVWTASPAEDVAGYRVYHTPAGGPEIAEDVGAAFTASITGLAEGHYTVFVAAYDTDGNESAGQPRDVIVDFTQPVVAAAPPGAVYDTAVTVTLTSTDTADPAPAILTCTAPGCTPTDEYAGPLTIDKDTVLRYRAVDWAGNTSTVGEENYTIHRASSGGGGGGGCFLGTIGW